MTARDVPRVIRALGVRTVLPIHYEGWRHFRESSTQAQEWLRRVDLDASVVWVAPGETATIPV
jgi:L-ascorbate metabolism protein UlaG (beta-lactamase superfamily)